MRRRRAQSFGGQIGSNPFDTAGEDVNPNSYLTNLSDCMLVLACGLMVALVVAWSVKLPSASEVEQTGDMQEVTDLEDITGEAGGAGAGYNELGMVYQDPQTGKMYLIKDAQGEGEASGSTGTDGEATDGQGAQGTMTDSISQTGTRDVPRAGTVVEDEE